jgi:hypothetical protein
MDRVMPDYGFGRCDGHHEMDDFRLKKNAAACACFTSPIDAMQEESPGRTEALRTNEEV